MWELLIHYIHLAAFVLLVDNLHLSLQDFIATKANASTVSLQQLKQKFSSQSVTASATLGNFCSHHVYLFSGAP